MADLIENCRGMIGLLTVLGALLLGAKAQQQEFGLVGSDVTLVPKYTGDLREIKWELNYRILVEFVLKPREEFIHNLPNDRTTINKTNGALTIRNLTKGDSGLYRAEALVNSIEDTEIRLTVRDCLDQPIISVETIEDRFVASCKSFSPNVTYEWFNQTKFLSKSRSYTEPKKNGTLTCVVGNKVCNKSSSINFYIPDQPEEKWVGNEVILVPKYTGDPSEIIWKVNGDNLVEMVLKPRGNFTFHILEDRAISEMDGRLIILELTMEDSGDYTAVVVVNNEYYYTEIRLNVQESRGPPEVDTNGIVIGSLSLSITLLIIFIFLLWYYCYKRPNQRENDDRKRLLRERKQRKNDDQKSETQSLVEGDDNVENGNAAPAVGGNIEGVKGDKDDDVEKGIALVPMGENVDDDDDDDKNVENGNAAPAVGGNIEGVKGDKDDDVKKGIALVPMGENVVHFDLE